VVTVWTDGSCYPNPGPGGWAAVVVGDGTPREITGSAVDTTNNRMEMTAVIEALRALPDDVTVTVYTDSQYVQRGATEWVAGWRKSSWLRRERGKWVALKNADLWQELDRQQVRTGAMIKWVRGHAGDPMNERADVLAAGARMSAVLDEAA
jgi:ribonuclease HI